MLNSGNKIPFNGMVAYYDAGNKKSLKSGDSSWKDLSGNNYHVPFINEASYNTFGGGSVFFDGSDDYSRLSTFYNADGDNDHSFCLWIYFQSLGNDERFYWLGNYGIICYKDTSDRIRFYTRVLGGSTDNLQSSNSVNSGEWVFICGVKNNSNKSVYVNMVETTSTQSGTIEAANNPTRLTFGLENTLVRQFNGYMNSIIIYNRALTIDEVNSIYNNTNRY
jgi:hypothetical protein